MREREREREQQKMRERNNLLCVENEREITFCV